MLLLPAHAHSYPSLTPSTLIAPHDTQSVQHPHSQNDMPPIPDGCLTTRTPLPSFSASLQPSPPSPTLRLALRLRRWVSSEPPTADRHVRGQSKPQRRNGTFKPLAPNPGDDINHHPNRHGDGSTSLHAQQRIEDISAPPPAYCLPSSKTQGRYDGTRKSSLPP